MFNNILSYIKISGHHGSVKTDSNIYFYKYFYKFEYLVVIFFFSRYSITATYRKNEL